MRVQSATTMRNGGWLHRLGNPTPAHQLVYNSVEEKGIDFENLFRKSSDKRNSWKVNSLAASLGVSSESLFSIGCAWMEDYRAYGFPMKDGDGRTIGIRLRTEAGKKFAVRGSRQGLFESSNPAAQTAFVCEGPTDTAAALSIGLWAVGRPSCSCGNEQLKALLAARGVRRAVILADNDAPGIVGAQRVATEVRLPCALLVLPAKDTRAFVQAGGTRGLVEMLLRQTMWRNP